MDRTLRTLYLRLDTNSKYLTQKAEAQLLVKIIYQKGGEGVSISQIIDTYKELVKHSNESSIQKILDELVDASEVSLNRKLYSLPKSKRKIIAEAQKQSEVRLSQILEHLRPYQSEDTDVKEWFIDSLVSFFNAFSDDWMSDLCYKIDAVARRKDSILDVIQKRTYCNKHIEKEDKEYLPKKFLEVLLGGDAEVSCLLWEYGMAAFSSKLINNSHILDDLAFDTFNDSSCILDTNILFAISLGYYEDSNKIRILERVFSGLKIKVGLLHITRKEYEVAVAIKRENLLKLVASYHFDVLRDTDDPFLKAAVSSGCIREEDFKHFFDKLLRIPEYVFEKVPIELFDDSSLEATISEAQSDKKKNEELNTIFKNVVGHDKKEQALKHDVGLISGTNYLRNNGRYFILSQEVSVNTYAKRKPSKENLPIAIRIDTLLNVLALGGGDPVIHKDFESLFAEMVRYGLQPSHNTYEIADLSIMLEKNEQITNLSPSAVKDIAQEIHRQRLLGSSDQEITTLMTRRIQGEKLKIRDSLQKTEAELLSEQRDNNRIKKINKGLNSALWNRIDTEVRQEIRRSKLCRYIRIFSYLILSCCLLTLFLWLSNIESIAIWIVTELLSLVLSRFLALRYVPSIRKKPLSGEEVEREVQRRFDAESNKD